MNIEIKIKIGEQEMSLEEARKIYYELYKIFEEKKISKDHYRSTYEDLIESDRRPSLEKRPVFIPTFQTMGDGFLQGVHDHIKENSCSNS